MGFRRRRAVPDDGLQVFLDPRHRRLRWTIIGAVLLGVIGLTLTIHVSRTLDTPVRQTPQALNQDIGFLREAIGDRMVPIIGDRERGVLTRIARVVKENGAVLLADPFSTEVWRPATEAEIAEIGDEGYVMERYGAPADRQLMLTFDDGPHPEATSEVLDLLKRNGVKATFFVIGNNVLRSPDLVRRTIAEGHMVASHTMDHTPDFYAQSDEANRYQLSSAERVILASADYATRVWRIPESQADIKPLAVLTGQQLGYLQADFDIDSHDWEYVQRGEGYIPVPTLDGRGHVVVMHDGDGDRTATLRLVQELIDQARNQGYSFTTMEPLLPEAFVPTRDILPTESDIATFESFRAIRVLPYMLIDALTVVGAVLFIGNTLLYTVAAGVYNRRARRKRWPDEFAGVMVSVLVPAYDEESNIEATLDSLAASDYANFEIIAINDGSKDRTGEILDRYKTEHPELRMTVLHQPNAGKPAALNHGMSYAYGEVVITMDGDTVFEPQTVRSLVRHFIDPTIGIVGGNVKVENRDRNVLTGWQSAEYLNGITLNRAADSLLGTVAVTPGACAAYRRKAVHDVGGFRTRTRAEDADITLELRKQGWRAVQENAAVAWTEAPTTVGGLFKQRLRWVFGYMQVLWMHHDMLLMPRYGALSLSLWYSVLSILMTVVFTPLLLGSVVLNLIHGHWQGPLAIYLVIMAVHLVQTLMALRIAKEDKRHLLVVPVYQFVSEPLRLAVMYVASISCLIGVGVAFGWNKIQREGTVPSIPQEAAIP